MKDEIQTLLTKVNAEYNNARKQLDDSVAHYHKVGATKEILAEIDERRDNMDAFSAALYHVTKALNSVKSIDNR
jgi:hypothetical protein